MPVFQRDKEGAMTATPETASSGIRSLIPARIDRLPWSRFHTRMVVALGVAWVLDGLEITIASNVGPDLTSPNTLHMSASGVADIATWYLIGEVIGALFFGQLSDKLGRKNLFLVTLGGLPGRVRPDRGHAEGRLLVHLLVPDPGDRRDGHRR